MGGRRTPPHFPPGQPQRPGFFFTRAFFEGDCMAIPKVMGIETEYGITVKNQPDFNPILSSLLLINSYETYRSSRVRWDYEAESPLRDARGFEYMEEKEGTSKEESRLINLILSNGARFYVDHAHPEYSSPETTNPRDTVIWDRAGERILNLSRQRAEAVSPPEQRILIYKNNTDSKGNSYGTHENYLMDRKVPFARIVQHMMPFFVTRQVYTGAGKVEDDFIEKDLSIDGPVAAFRKVSRDLTCRETIRLKDGRMISAVDHQREFLALAQRYFKERQQPEPWVAEVLGRWESTLDRLAEDPTQLGRDLDWVIKRQLIENYVAKHDLEWSDHRVQMIDLQYHDIRPGKGLYYKLEESEAVDRIVTDDEISKAIYDPPKDTRAYFRGMCLQRYAEEIVSASWDSVIFDLKEGPLKKIFMLEPLRGTETHVRQLLTESPTASDLLRNISRPTYGV